MISNLEEFSDYLNDEELLGNIQNASSLDGRGKTLLYVEAPFDVGCWNQILETLDVSDYFEVATYGQNSGKEELVKLFKDGKLHKMQMIAIDADLDRLTGYEIEKFEHPFVFDTYVYSIEGVILHKDIIHEFIQKIIRDYRIPNINFLDFIDKYSLLCYQELSKTVNHFRGGCGEKGPDNLVEHFKVCDLSEETIKQYLEGGGTDIFHLIGLERGQFTCDTLCEKGVNKEDAYQYIRGHSLKKVIEFFVKNLLSLIERKNKAKIRKDFQGERSKIGENVNAMLNILHSKYNLETYIRMVKYPLDKEPLTNIALKINSTIQNHMKPST